jgi:DNA-binding response OmpR family regulator
MRVLVVEDERPLAAGLRNGLVAEGSRSTWRWTAPTGCGPRAPL